MKKIYVGIFLIFIAAQTSAQSVNFRSFKFGVGLGPAYCDQNGFTGFAIFFEPAINANDVLSIGFRMESGGIGPSDSLDNYAMEIVSFAFSVQYYLSLEKFRPFLGGGFGWYYFNEGDDIGGIFLRAGFDFGHLSLSADYNIVVPPEDSATPFTTYIGGRVAFFIGGGRKK